MMRKMFLMSWAAVVWSLLLPVAAADEISGKWSGPWYRGMTSGTMTLEIDADGRGNVAFTNLDNFGESAVPVATKEITNTGLTFSAAGAGAAVFSASSRLVSNGKVLKGKGEYEGFAIEFKLKRR